MDESQTFAQLVQARLANDILNGSLEPGSKLKLQALCETYEVSMSPLREALAGLTGRGLVYQEGQRGFRVAAASFDDLRDVTETRIHIETTALRLSMERGGDEWEAAVLAAHHRLARRLRSKDLLVDETWEALHRGYHMALIGACGLPRLLDICTGLHDHFDRYRRLGVLHANRHPKIRSSHAAIVKLTLARDAERAVALLGEHIQESADQFAMLLRSNGETKLLKPADASQRSYARPSL
jgi:GntR family carbon starvation induced transcriptional regulator